MLLCCGGITTCVLWGKRQVAKIQTEGIGGLTLNKDGTGFTVKTEEGEVNLGGGSLPASFPKDLPVYAGMRAQSSTVNTKEGSGTAVLTGKATARAAWCEYRHVNQAERFVRAPMDARDGAYHATIPASYTDSPYRCSTTSSSRR